MSQPFLGEIRTFGFNFAPVGWALCDGQLLSIAQNTALFSLLGTTYGGNGQTTFALPDLRGRAGIHMGQGPGLSPYTEGQVGGSESVTLTLAQMPAHSHPLLASNASATASRPNGNVPAMGGSYTSAGDGSMMKSDMVQNAGGNQPHQNLQPYLVLNFCIAIDGIFPSRN